MTLVKFKFDRRSSTYPDDNPSKVLLADEPIFLEDGRVAFGDGSTALSALTWYRLNTLSSERLTGGTITIGSFGGSGSNNDIRVAAASWFIVGHGDFSTSSNTEFLDIALSSAGNQRYIGIYGKNDGTIIKSEGTEAALASLPSTPANHAVIGYVLVGDASIGGSVDLSGYLLKSDKATQSTVIAETNDTTYITPLANAKALKKIAYDYNDSSSITGTTSETKIGTGLLIPANSIKAGDVVSIRAVMSQASLSGGATIRIYINTSDSLSGATLLGFQSGTGARPTISRRLFVKAANTTKGALSIESIQNEFAEIFGNATSATELSVTADWTANLYIVTSFAPSNTLAVTTRRYIDVIKE